MSLATELTTFCKTKKIEEVREICDSLNISYTDIIKIQSGYIPMPSIRHKIEKLLNKDTKKEIESTRKDMIFKTLIKEYKSMTDTGKLVFKFAVAFAKKTGEYPCVQDFIPLAAKNRTIYSCHNYEANVSTRYYRTLLRQTSLYKFPPLSVIGIIELI